MENVPRVTSPVVIGRDEEVGRLMRALDVIEVDGPAVVLVAGEAGVGKTRLVEALATEARRRNVRVGSANCIDLADTIYPLAPVRDLIAGLLDGLDDEAVDLVLGPGRGELTRVLPELGDVRTDAPGMSSEQLCELVIGVLDRVARRGPLLVVVEDLHWADATTRMMLAALGRTRPTRPLLLVGTFRDDELHRRHPLRPLLAELERRPNCERIAVRPLDRWETGLLIEALEPALAHRDLIEQVHRRGGGNPFFVEELVAARRAGLTIVPDALRDVVLAHTAIVDDDGVAVLGALAAAGEASAELLSDVTGLDADRTHAALVGLRATSLLAGGEVARFRHELAREVCYDELVPGERTRLHARLAAGPRGPQPGTAGADRSPLVVGPQRPACVARRARCRAAGSRLGRRRRSGGTFRPGARLVGQRRRRRRALRHGPCRAPPRDRSSRQAGRPARHRDRAVPAGSR